MFVLPSPLSSNSTPRTSAPSSSSASPSTSARTPPTSARTPPRLLPPVPVFAMPEAGKGPAQDPGRVDDSPAVMEDADEEDSSDHQQHHQQRQGQQQQQQQQQPPSPNRIPTNDFRSGDRSHSRELELRLRSPVRVRTRPGGASSGDEGSAGRAVPFSTNAASGGNCPRLQGQRRHQRVREEQRDDPEDTNTAMAEVEVEAEAAGEVGVSEAREPMERAGSGSVAGSEEEREAGDVRTADVRLFEAQVRYSGRYLVVGGQRLRRGGGVERGGARGAGV